MDSVITVDGLVLSYGAFAGFDGLNLQVARGEVHGFLGPNGAGKSTSIRVLPGLLKAGAGNVEVLGGDPWHDVVELLILDEPTSGLGPLMELILQEEIETEKTRGRSVLLSGPILSEAEALADRVSIMRDGLVVQTGTLDRLRRGARARLVLPHAPRRCRSKSACPA